MVKLGLIGYPLSHSLSPKLQTAALAECGLQGEYLLYPIPPEDNSSLSSLLSRVRSGEIAGLNVTIPHKQNIIPLLDVLTPSARAIGAVNTIYIRDGSLTGDNTDAPGFFADLQRTLNYFPLSRKEGVGGSGKALILGAGGSARAVNYALASSGWQVTVASRRAEQARDLIQSLEFARSQNIKLQVSEKLRSNLEVGPLEAIALEAGILQKSLDDVSLIVNTTPVGMFPKVDTSPWPEGLEFPHGAGVYDLVYNPRETLLVKQARASGLQAVTGLGMLVEQAALAFEIWTGRKPSREVMFSSVEE